ncbi:MAG: hemolysin III family protein [Myxococcales bacterium]
MNPAKGPPEGIQEKPLLRGVSHQIAFFFAIAAAGVLLSLARGPRATWGAAAYGASLVALLGTSALYHRVQWRPRPRAWMRRLDHSAIFVLIAGTFTPFSLLLPGRRAAIALTLIWAGAALGFAQSLIWVNAPKPIVAVLCVVMGWSAIPLMGSIRAATGTIGLELLLAGGVFYSLGALAYALRRPNPVPGVFGYHEVFHALVIVASVCHFGVVQAVVRAL